MWEKLLSSTQIKSGILFIIAFVTLFHGNVYAQVQVDGTPIANSMRSDTLLMGPVSPGRYFDTVFDRFGNKFLIGQLAINDTIRNIFNSHASTYSSYAPAPPPPATHLYTACVPGYFQIYLEDNCGMDHWATDMTEQNRLNVLCQVLTDISNFIQSPCSITGQKVNIWVRGGLTTGLGVATPFFNIPYSTTKSGIVDNTEWLTINSGVDAFKNIVSPLVTIGGGTSGSGTGSVFFHGSIAINFSTESWNTDLTTPPAVGYNDLYTVLLHEMLHTLGFCTLIDYSGRSVFDITTSLTDPSRYQYYSRYDLHLVNHDLTANLITGSAVGCDLYQFGFNTATFGTALPFSVLSPSLCATYSTGPETDETGCGHAVYYVGSPGIIPVYTPDCYERGGSLSHFEDECYAPTGFPLAPPLSNNEYFVMSNSAPNISLGTYSIATNPGVIKRCPTPEERKVLCDIGYVVNPKYGIYGTASTYPGLSGPNLNYYDYGGTTSCGNPQVVGITDGMVGSAYTFTCYSSGSVLINGAGASILDNDYDAVGGIGSHDLRFKCLEVMTGSGTITTSSGNYSTLVQYNPAPADYGIQLLRYIPISSTGVEGNITYIYVYVSNGQCTHSTCNMIPNDGFESIASAIPSYPNCWSWFTGSPDVFFRAAGTAFADIPGSYIFATTGEVHALSAPGNDHYMGIVTGPDGTGNFYVESLGTTLSPSIFPSTYTISFWAKFADAPSFGTGSTLPGNIQFGISPTPIAGPAININALPAGLTQLADFIITPADGNWHYYTQDVTYTGAPANFLTILNAGYLNPVTYPAMYTQYIVVDDVNIIPASTSCPFSIPGPICNTTPAFALSTIASVCPLIGTFSWPTLPIVGGLPTIVTSATTLFNPADVYNASVATGGTGLISVGYTYTTLEGCQRTVATEVQVGAITPPAIMGLSSVCSGSSITMSDASPIGIWTSSNPSVATVTAGMPSIVDGITPGTTTIMYTTTCGSVTAIITVNPLPGVILGGTTVCPGAIIILTDITSGGSWSSSDPTIATVSPSTGNVNGIANGVAIITYKMSTGCYETKEITVTNTPLTPITSGLICIGTSTTLIDITLGGEWSSSNPLVATIDAGTGSITPISAGTSIITYMTGCGFTTTTVTVNPLPETITGIGAICTGSATSLTDATAGGTWSSNNTAVGTIDGSGSVFGLSAGTTMITYMLSTGCYVTTIVTVNPLPATITGMGVVCAGSVTSVIDATTGGSWSSSNTTVGTVDISGNVTGLTTGTTIITYILPTGCYVTTIVTVNPLPATITGIGAVCEGSATSLIDATTGGTWNSSNTAVGTVDGSGNVTSLSVGTTIITYMISTGCYVTTVVTVNPLPDIITGTASVCVGSNTSLTDITTGGTWSSSNTTVGTVGVSGNVTGLSTGTTIVTYMLSTGCYVTAIVTVNPVPIVSAGADQVLCTYGVTFTASATGGTPGYNYVWTPPSPLSSSTSSSYVMDPYPGVSTGVLTVTVTDANGCSSMATVILFVPTGTCSPCGSGIFGPIYALGLSGSIGVTGSTTLISSGYYYIDNNTTIYGNVIFNDAVVMVNDGVTISIDPAASVVSKGSHFFSCVAGMWNGFVLNSDGSQTGTITLGGDGTSMKTGRSTLIEDAITAVTVTAPITPNSSSPNFISSYNTVFNRNNTGISIGAYTPALSATGTNTYEFHIENTVFTSRRFGAYVSGSIHYPFAWPNTTGTHGLKTAWTPLSQYLAPYNLTNPNAGGAGIAYPAAPCHNSVPTTTGIVMNGIGTNSYLSTSGYSSIIVGSPSTAILLVSTNTELNLFEGLNNGIFATNANLTVNNSSFANIHPVNSFPIVGIGGYGIYTAMKDATHYQLTVEQGLYSYFLFGSLHTNRSPNSFYNCTQGVYSSNYYTITGNHSLMVTTQAYTSMATLIYLTNWGYNLQSSAYDAVNVNNNTIYNTANGISFTSTLGAGYWVHVGPYEYFVSGSQHDGDIVINNNNIRATIEPYTLATTAFCSFGIAVQNVLNNTHFLPAGLAIYTSGKVRTDSNTINDAYRGILVQSYWMQQAIAYQNKIVVGYNPADVKNSFMNYGISHNDCSKDMIYKNQVYGEPLLPKLVDSMRAYYMAFNSSANISCNLAQDIGRGFEFFQKNPSTSWMGNTMQNHLKGMVLNGGIIGPQGSYHHPADNEWLTGGAGWSTAHFQTAVLSGATATSSPMWVNNNTIENPGLNPTFNFGLPANIYSTANGSVHTAGIAYWPPPCASVSVATVTPFPLLPVHEQIVRKQILYPTDSAVNDFLGQYTTWQMLKQDSTLTDSSDVLNSFNTMATNSRFAHITNIEQSLVAGDDATATTQLTASVPPLVGSGISVDSTTGANVADDDNSTFIVDNYKTFYGVYLNYMKGMMNSDDSANVVFMAGLCPSRFGSAVYRARSLYTVVFNDLKIWNDDSCAAADTGSHISARHTSHTDTTLSTIGVTLNGQRYNLFPNPNDGVMTLTQMLLDNAAISIEVSDVVGRTVYKKSVLFEEGNYRLKIDNLMPGMYLMQLTDVKARKFMFKFVKE